jgi:hypothetical protein
MRNWSTPLFFVFCICAGWWVTDHAWNGQIFVYVGERRAPAAVRSLLDYSSFDRKALYRSAQAQLLAPAEVVLRDRYVGLRFGHPFVTRAGGGKAFGCQLKDHSGVFDHIEITFIGTGITDSGEPARMTIDSPCRALQDVNHLETVWIPMGDIFASPARDQELQTYGDQPVTVRLEQIPAQWPQNWVLWNIRLYSEDNPDRSLVLDTRRLKEARPTLLSFDWPAAGAHE